MQRSTRSEWLFQILVVGMVIVFSVLSLIYLSHSNAVATSGYTIKQLQQEQVSLQNELAVERLKVSRLQSLQALEQSDKVVAMTGSVEVTKYVQTEAALALR